MGILGWALLAGGAVVIGMVVPLIREVPGARHRSLLTAVAALVGALVVSQWLYPTAEPVWEGLALWPALIGGLVVAIVADVVYALLSGGSWQGSEGHGSPAS